MRFLYAECNQANATGLLGARRPTRRNTMFKKMLIATVISGLALTSAVTFVGAAEIQAQVIARRLLD